MKRNNNPSKSKMIEITIYKFNFVIKRTWTTMRTARIMKFMHKIR